jgi:hypothetical protein
VQRAAEALEGEAVLGAGLGPQGVGAVGDRPLFEEIGSDDAMQVPGRLGLLG